MSRALLLVFLLLVLVITSQFEWKQSVVTDIEANPSVSQKQLRISQREKTIKEKIILSQERNIHKLNEMVRSLRRQLQECRSSNGSANTSLSNLTGNIIELERQHILEA